MAKDDSTIFTLPIGANFAIRPKEEVSKNRYSKNIWRGVVVGTRKGRNYEANKVFLTIELNKDSSNARELLNQEVVVIMERRK